MRHLLAAGSASGRDHSLSERPNQDAYALLQGSWGAVAVVCDGCGSEPHSGVGARIGACMTARLAAEQLESSGGLDLRRLQLELLSRLCAVAEAACIGVREHLLFTVIGAACSGQTATVFSCGDGVVAVDGAVRRLVPFPGNAPPYLAYGLDLVRLYQGPASSVLIGTDGAADIDLSRFWNEERFLRNPDMVRRTLRTLRLADDATVAVILGREA